VDQPVPTRSPHLRISCTKTKGPANSDRRAPGPYATDPEKFKGGPAPVKPVKALGDPPGCVGGDIRAFEDGSKH